MAVDEPQTDVPDRRPEVGEDAEEQAAVAAEDERPPPSMSLHAGPQGGRQGVCGGDGVGQV